jgi:hypothetical protein
MSPPCENVIETWLSSLSSHVSQLSMLELELDLLKDNALLKDMPNTIYTLCNLFF